MCPRNIFAFVVWPILFCSGHNDKYVAGTGAETWINAEAACGTQFSTQLASIHNYDEWGQAIELCATTFDASCWIGLRRPLSSTADAHEVETNYEWSDGTAVTTSSFGFTSSWLNGFERPPWAVYQPDDNSGGTADTQHCIRMDKADSYGWEDQPCDVVTLNFICEAPTTTSPTDSPSDSPTEPPSDSPIESPSDQPTEAPTPCPKCESVAPYVSQLQSALQEVNDCEFLLKNKHQCRKSTLCRKINRILKAVIKFFKPERRRLSSGFDSAIVSEILVNEWKEGDRDLVSVSIPFCGKVGHVDDDELIKMFTDIVHVQTSVDDVVIETEAEAHKFDECKHYHAHMVTIRQKPKDSYKDMTVKIISSIVASVSLVVVVRFFFVR